MLSFFTSGPTWLFLVGGLAIAIIFWIFLTILSGRKKAHSRKAHTFWRKKYEGNYGADVMLVALCKEGPLAHRFTVKDAQDRIVATLNHAPAGTTLTFGNKQLRLGRVLEYFKPLSFDLEIDGKIWRCCYQILDQKTLHAKFNVNDDEPFSIQVVNKEKINGEYTIQQGASQAGIIYTEHNAIDHYAVMLLCDLPYPIEIRAVFLMLEARRYWFWPGMPQRVY